MLFKSSRRKCSLKKVFLQILHNSQWNICARVSFLKKLQVSAYQKRLQHRRFPVNFVKFVRTPFCKEHPQCLFLSIQKKRSKSSAKLYFSMLRLSTPLSQECDTLYLHTDCLFAAFLKQHLQLILKQNAKLVDVNISSNDKWPKYKLIKKLFLI